MICQSSRASPGVWPDAHGLYFPYMTWAHTSANRTDHPLTQSARKDLSVLTAA